jgi:hypothetical protein
VEAKKTVVIITDGAPSVRDVADQIGAALEGSCRVISLTAPDFQGNDILPADVIFLGCVNPNPPSFAYLEEFFRHINLAGLSCGIFSASDKTVRYLGELVKDSDMIPAKPFTGTGGAELQTWIKGVLP